MRASVVASMHSLQWILYSKFRQHREQAVDVLVMLAVGHVFGCYTPNELAQVLGISKSVLYQGIGDWSLYQWRRMLMQVGCRLALEELQRLEGKSAATLARAQVTIGVDDTVVDRLGRLLSLTYSWWSGNAKKVLQGQNLLAIVIRIGPRVIPLMVLPVSKQGRGNTSKPELLHSMMEEVLAFFAAEGIDLTQYAITFDSWYGSAPLAELLQGYGFDKITVHCKSNWVMEIDGERLPLSEHKNRIGLRAGEWGCGNTPVARRRATSPTFGQVTLLFFQQGGQVKVVMVFGRALRAAEILNIWKQHHGIEQFWKSLKSILQIQRLSLRGPEGAYATVAIKLLAYVLMTRVAFDCHITLSQLQREARKNLDLHDFFLEHFHRGLAPAA